MRSKGTLNVAKVPAYAKKPHNGPPAALHAQQQAKVQVRLKLLVRRLPPALTEDEFFASVGEEWKIGAGKVDWVRYDPGQHNG